MVKVYFMHAWEYYNETPHIVDAHNSLWVDSYPHILFPTSASIYDEVFSGPDNMYLFFFFFAVLCMEHLPGKCSTTELHTPPPIFSLNFETWSC
jgi:hypothetical protein